MLNKHELADVTKGMRSATEAMETAAKIIRELRERNERWQKEWEKALAFIDEYQEVCEELLVENEQLRNGLYELHTEQLAIN